LQPNFIERNNNWHVEKSCQICDEKQYWHMYFSKDLEKNRGL